MCYTNVSDVFLQYFAFYSIWNFLNFDKHTANVKDTLLKVKKLGDQKIVDTTSQQKSKMPDKSKLQF